MAFDLCGHEGGKPSADVVPASNGGLFEREHDHGVAPPVAAPTTSVGIPDREGLETIGRGRVGAGGAFKEVLEHRGDQRLAKAARAAEENNLAAHQDVFDEHGFIDEDAALVYGGEPVAAGACAPVARDVGHQSARGADGAPIIADGEGRGGCRLAHGVSDARSCGRTKMHRTSPMVPASAAHSCYGRGAHREEDSGALIKP